MFSLRNSTIKRLNKRAAATIESWKKKNGREPTLADIHSFHALGPFDRVSFIVVGGIFVWISIVLLTDAWIFPCLLLPISGYVTIRGVIGHKLKLTPGNQAVLATPDSLVASAENQLTSLGQKLLVLDICFATLLGAGKGVKLCTLHTAESVAKHELFGTGTTSGCSPANCNQSTLSRVLSRVMTAQEKTARLAGFLYLVVVVTGIFSLGYVPSQIPLSGGAQAAIDNIKTSEQLFRFGIAASIILQTTFLLLPLALFRLLRPVNEPAAICMVVLAVVSVPLALVSLSSRLDLLSLATNAIHIATLETKQVHAEVLLALTEQRNQLLLTKVFWGFWLFPFGLLVFKSRFLPRILGVLLMLGCFGYLAEVFGRLVVPGYAESTLARFVTKPATIGEIGTCLWLLIVGVRPPRSAAAQPQSAP